MVQREGREDGLDVLFFYFFSPPFAPPCPYLLDFGLHAGGAGGHLVEGGRDLLGLDGGQGVADGHDRLDHSLCLQREVSLRAGGG